MGVGVLLETNGVELDIIMRNMVLGEQGELDRMLQH
jgi:hypothetical protein